MSENPTTPVRRPVMLPGGPGEHARLVFKHEIDIDGDPAGPLHVLHPETYNGPRVYDPEAPAPEWVTRTEALARAEALDMPLVEV